MPNFWNNVTIRDKEDCWNWTACKDRAGYGRKWWNQRLASAHRIAWILTFGDIPDGLLVLHKCDNRKCCNPNHLFLGTQQQNMDDMKAKGRVGISQGETNGRSKLLASQVREINSLYNLRQNTTAQIAEKFGVSKTAIWNIVHGKAWDF